MSLDSLAWLMAMLRPPVEAPSEQVAAQEAALGGRCIICGEAATGVCEACASSGPWCGFADNGLRALLGCDEAEEARSAAGPVRMWEVDADDGIYLVRARCSEHAAEIVDAEDPISLGVVEAFGYNVRPDSKCCIVRRPS